MTREEFALFLKSLRDAEKKGLDTDAIVKAHEHENVYIYNDACLKKIFASEKNIALTTDLVNASLNLVGDNRVENPKLVNPFIPGELGYRNSEPDLVLVNERENGQPRDRISIEVQHEGGLTFKNRVVLYVSRLSSNMVKKSEPPILENLNLVVFQFFDVYPWRVSRNYRHSIQLRNQEQLLYYDKQTITVIEVKKFFSKAKYFASDDSRLAQWLRAIDTLNRGADFSEFANDPIFGVLQEEAKLSNFSSRYLMMEGMTMTDAMYLVYNEREKIARNLLKNGHSPKDIARNTELPLSFVYEIKKALERGY